MLLRKIILFVLFIVLISANTIFAAPVQNSLTDIRWATHTDGATGKKTVRLVLDVTDPVSVDSELISTPTPRLLVNIKGADMGTVRKDIDFDGSIVEKINFNNKDSKYTQMTIELPQLINSDDYHVFTLKRDAQAKKPFRIVVDIKKPEEPVVYKPDTPTVSKNQQALTNVRWFKHKDLATGNDLIRLVVDVTDAISVDSMIVTSPTPKLVVNMKDANIGSVQKKIDFDGSIVEKVNLRNIDNQAAQMVIDLPGMINSEDYRVFTLRSNPGAKKPFRVVVDVKKTEPPIVFNFTPGLKNKVIAIDPGHGGSDPGAIGLNKTTEKAITLAVATKVKELLEKAGAKVLMTRTKDIEVATPTATDAEELGARTTIANLKKADAFISIHCNAFTNREAGGTATYYYAKSKYDELLAKNIQTYLIPQTQLQDRGVQQAGFYVVKRTKMPASLIELAFISNPREEKLLNTPAFQQQMAQGIVNGIDKFFTAASK